MALGVGNCQVLVLILCIGELLTVGILLFSHGFLLTRQVVDKKSTCKDIEDLTLHMKNYTRLKNSNDCWTAPIFKKAVILLIDALRYDFALYNSSIKDPRPYQNKMEVFESIIKSHPMHARLYPFVADAPTTTMQRLKGLTTGSLPTFIDASQNFASEEINEDNIVDQLVGCGKKITMLGDDTWGGLFPGRFNRAFLYPSFNVMDLHTVDNGVISHLDEELARDDWDIIIAHFLGVDHCGHRYGPDHPEMELKLLQMNEMIKNVMKNIEDDTLLLVLGDHGMTRTGDHGGDSVDEITAALFAYSHSLNIPLPLQHQSVPFPVAQVDLIPTLALALGVPIPYSNLGRVIEDLLITVNHTFEEAAHHQVFSLELNVHQVANYLEEYRKHGSEFPDDMWQRLEFLSEKISRDLHELPLDKQKQVFVEYLTLAKLMCEEVWAKFSMTGMTSGLLLMVAVITLAYLVLSSEVMADDEMCIVNRIFYITLFVNALFVFSFYISVVILGLVAFLVLAIFLYFHRSRFSNIFAKIDLLEIIPLFIALSVCLGTFSNSYVVVENYVTAFLLVSVVTVQVFSSFMKQQKKKSVYGLPSKLVKWASNYWGLMSISSLLVVLVCVRISSWFWKCREEQPWCIPGHVHTTLAGLPQVMRNWRYFTSVFSLILLTWLPRRWLMMCGNLNGSKLGVVLVRKVPVICSILVASHWALQAVPSLQGSPLRMYVVLPPLLTYFFAVFLMALLFFVPLLIYEVPPRKDDIGPVTENPYNCIPQLYHSLKAKYSTDNPKRQSIPIVYGLATAVSAPLVGTLIVLLIVIVLLAGDGVSPGILLLVGTTVACLSAQAASTWMNADSLGDVMKPSWSSVCTWFMLSLHFFYSTGHHATFPSLHWSAAFVGFEGQWGSSNVIPAILVGFNTFSAQIIFAFSLPLIVLCPLSFGVVFPKLRNSRLEGEDTRQGEFLFVEDRKIAASSLLFTSVLYIILHAIKVLFSAASAFILRRHLMVWKIFAPHFIFDAVSFIVTSFFVPLGVLFTLRIIDVLDMFGVYLRHKYS
ncbi:GPI ethanolamine phosphate transferase 3-like isoform X1 [Macrobrachium nipponense]|uniref:GPI ethanolamine phosphate transferase 3-like isoform X1 n=2 Tax=Macrobrachium nipponense TaxID=159736 RepID=UPI0030C8CAA3